MTHDHLERFGFPAGLGLIFGSTGFEWLVGRGASPLSVAGVSVGIMVSLITCYVRVDDHRRKWKGR